MIDESLFSKDASTGTRWPNMEILEVMFHPAHSNGSWYFHGPQGEGRNVMGFKVTDEHYPPYEKTELDEEMQYLHDERPNRNTDDGNSQYRITPDENRLRPLLKSFAEAAIHIPFLKSACLWSPLNWSNVEAPEIDFDKYTKKGRWSYVWGVCHNAPEGNNESKSSRKLNWAVGSWHPDPELHVLIQRIGNGKYGQDLDEEWILGKGSENPLIERYASDCFFSDELQRITFPY